MLLKLTCGFTEAKLTPHKSAWMLTWALDGEMATRHRMQRGEGLLLLLQEPLQIKQK